MVNSETGEAPLKDNAVETMSRHVLVVDDEPYICLALRRILEREGYRVTTVDSGEAALEVVARDEPHVVLLDIMMPGMDGRETCRRIRATSAAAKVIYLTGKADAYGESTSKGLRAEADGLIPKPATKEQILQEIQQASQSRGG